jgi:lipopolysaccharide/colanic/teichoic acid biosynthesis glycosyltransferase
LFSSEPESISVKRIGILLAVVVAVLAIAAALGPISAIVVFVVLVLGERYMERRSRTDRLRALCHRAPKASKVGPEDLGISTTKYARSFCVDGDPFPPYVKRPEDEQVRQALSTHRIVILEGTRHAGKSRTAFEAVRGSKGLHLLVLKPTVVDINPLKELLEDPRLIPRRVPVAIFVDRFDQYLAGVDRQTLDAWVRSRPRAMLLASIRTDRRRAVEDPEHPASHNASHVLVDDLLVHLDADLSGTSRRRAIKKYRRREAARLGPFLGGSTQILDLFKEARSRDHLAFGLVMAAVEARRGGVERGIAKSKLVELAQRIGLIPGDASPDEMEAAFETCTAEADGVMSMLVPEGTSEEGEELLRANSVLVDSDLDRFEEEGSLRTLSRSTWLALQEMFAVDGEEAIAIGSAARDALPRSKEPDWLGEFAIDLLSSDSAASDPDRQKSRQAMALAKGVAIAQQGEPSAQELAIEGSLADQPDSFKEEIAGAMPRLDGPEDTLFNARLPSAWPPPAFYAKPGRRNLIRFVVLALCDLVALAAAMAIAATLARKVLGDGVSFDSLKQGAVVALPLTVVLYAYLGLYRPHATRARLGELLKGLSIVALALVLVALAEQFVVEAVFLIAAAWVTAITIDLGLRFGYDFISRRWVVDRGLSARTLFVVPSGSARRLAEVLRQTSKRPMQFIGFVSSQKVDDLAQLGTTPDLATVISSYYVERVILADPALSAEERGEKAALCHLRRVAVELLPTLAEILQEGGDAVGDVSVPLIELPPLYLSRFNARVKRGADLVLGGAFCLLIWWWLFAGIYLLLAIAGGGSPLIRTTRLGRRQPFSMYRFKVSSASRPTVAGPINRFLERSKIDELPQLLNVLRGEMSLVGPRPLTVTQYRRLSPQGRLRYAVKPGLTGLWQVASWRQARRESEQPGMLGELDLMAMLDLIYCRRWSPLLDLTIALRTPFVVLIAMWPVRTRDGQAAR